MVVIVTRAQPDAARWVRDLCASGLQAKALPLMAVQPVADADPLRQAAANLARYAAVMFVSAHAVEGFFAAAPSAAARFAQAAGALPRAWCTGPGTMAALRRSGVAEAAIDAPPAQAQQLDSETLWRVVGRQLAAGQRLLIVRGSDAGASAGAEGVGRDWLAQQARASGATVEFVVAYQRGLPELDTQALALAADAAGGQAVWLFSSSQAIANLRQLMPRQAWSQARALATHERIAAAAREAGFGVVCASRPGLADVVASIESMQ